jgi:fimbrial chaperone protein
MNSRFCRKVWLLAVLFAALPECVFAAGFSAGISPSKFELRARPGQILRDTVTIFNPAESSTDFQFRTTDWELTDTSSVQFFEDVLLDGSCRPWVRLERKAVRIESAARRNYRFEVHIPEKAEPGLCRFAILIEPAERAQANADGIISMPIVGRFAVIVYVTIGDATADIEYLGMGRHMSNSERLPTLRLQNNGTTYDRAFGRLIGTDSEGQRIALTPSSFPVLPGRIEEIRLQRESAANAASTTAPLEYPLAITGRIEIGGDTIEIDELFE